jgi:TetR/AcrR family transcriptional repressor of nem operon
MPRPASDKRQRLTDAATVLALTRGFEHTSISDIATAADVPTGSVYYYFKTKDDVARAIIEMLRTQLLDLIAQWDDETEPRERLLAYIANSEDNAPTFVAHGSSVAVLSNDLLRYSAELGEEIRTVIQVELEWVAQQFVDLGFSPDAATARAMHLVAGLEGGATLAHMLASPTPLLREAAHLRRWVENTKEQ